MTYKHKDGFTYDPNKFKASPQESYLLARSARLGEDARNLGRALTKCQAERKRYDQDGHRISARLGK